jgi:hypothetical protein
MSRPLSLVLFGLLILLGMFTLLVLHYEKPYRDCVRRHEYDVDTSYRNHAIIRAECWQQMNPFLSY